MKLFSYVFRNVRRHKLRSLLTMMAIAICLMLMTFLYGFLEAREAWGREAEKHNRVVVMHRQGFSSLLPINMVDKVRQQEGVVAASPFSWFGGKYGDNTVQFAQFGVDPEYVFDIWTELKIPDEQLEAFKKDRQACVIDRKLAKRLGIEIGDRIRLQGTFYQCNLDLLLVGMYDPPDTGDMLFFNLKYLHDGLRQQAGGRAADMCGTIYFKAASAGIIPELCRKIDDQFANSSDPTKTQSETAFVQMFVNMLGNVQTFILFIGVFVTISLTLVAANGMAMSMRERTTEIAVLKAIGFQNGKILALMLGEAVLIAGIGGVLGVAAGRGIYALAYQAAPEFIGSSSMPWIVMVWGMAVAAGIGLASGIVPAVLAARLSVVDGLRRIV